MERHMQPKEVEILTDLLKMHSPTEVADGLRVHNVHIYRFKNDGYISPTLQGALVENGFIPESPTRIRSCVDWGYGEDAERARKIFNKMLEKSNCGMRGVVAEWFSGNFHVLDNEEEAKELLSFMFEWKKL